MDTLTKQEGRDLKYFKDAMYEALQKVHETNGSKLRIKVPTDIVDNISYSFARARLLNSDLAKRADSFFMEWPNQLLTAVPTDFELKKPWTSQGNCKYAFSQNRLGERSQDLPNSLCVPLTGLVMAMEHLNNFLLMVLLEWHVKSTPSKTDETSWKICWLHVPPNMDDLHGVSWELTSSSLFGSGFLAYGSTMQGGTDLW